MNISDACRRTYTLEKVFYSVQASTNLFGFDQVLIVVEIEPTKTFGQTSQVQSSFILVYLGL